MPAEKLARLQDWFLQTESCLVAYSGGVDSVFLAHVGYQTLGNRSLAVIADSPSLPRRELQEAIALGSQFGFPVQTVQTSEFNNPSYTANPANRCYFCKHELFTHLLPIARSGGFKVIAYGENASDVGDFRPGSQAATEFQIRAPLKELGFSKADIRHLSATFGLPTADKPQMACLSSRIPYGEPVTPEKLRMIEDAENLLRDLGLKEVRVRHHEIRGGHLARIELHPSEFHALLTDQPTLANLVNRIQRSGYQQVTLDLQGYRRGSANEQLDKLESQPITFRPRQP